MGIGQSPWGAGNPRSQSPKWSRACGNVNLAGWGGYLSSAVAPKPLQVLSVGQVVGETPVLKRDSGVNESGSSTVVVHEERLQIDQ